MKKEERKYNIMCRLKILIKICFSKLFGDISPRLAVQSNEQLLENRSLKVT